MTKKILLISVADASCLAKTLGEQGGLGSLSKRVMVLGEKEDSRLIDLLRRRNVAVEFCSHGDQAVAMAKVIQPDLLITEVLLPGLDGLELCRLIKSDPDTAGTKVLVNSILHAKRRSIEAGADGFVLHSVSDEDLALTLDGLLGLDQKFGFAPSRDHTDDHHNET